MCGGEVKGSTTPAWGEVRERNLGEAAGSESAQVIS